jgi:hypothetical protein
MPLAEMSISIGRNPMYLNQLSKFLRKLCMKKHPRGAGVTSVTFMADLVIFEIPHEAAVAKKSE